MQARNIDWESLLLAWTALVALGMILLFTAWTGAHLVCVLGAFGSFITGGSIAGALGYRLGRKKGRSEDGGPAEGSATG